MPRGVYDRSKTKKTAAATETKTIEKKARAPWGSKKAAKAETSPSSVKYEGLSLAQLANIRASFTGAQPNTVIIGKIDTLITRQLDAMIGTTETVEAKVEKVAKTVQAAAPVQMPAPVQATAPFNPVVPSNGQA